MNEKIRKSFDWKFLDILHCCTGHGVQADCLEMCKDSCKRGGDLEESIMLQYAQCQNYIHLVQMCCNGKYLKVNIDAITVYKN